MIYCPTSTAEGTFGAIAISPGLNGTWPGIAWLGPRLSSQGFVVFGIETNNLNDSPTSRGAQLLAALDYPTRTSSVRTRVDANRLAVAGHSMGGGGALDAALRRPALKAAIGNAPYLPSGSLAGDRVPTLIYAMQNDTLVTPARLTTMYNTIPPATEKAYIEVAGAGHNYIGQPSTTLARTMIPWLKIFLDNDTRYSQFLCPLSTVQPERYLPVPQQLPADHRPCRVRSRSQHRPVSVPPTARRSVPVREKPCALYKGGGAMVDSRMTRRAMIGGSLSVFATMGLPSPALVRGAERSAGAATRYGKVRGRREDGIVKFLGVPYARPPLGELRFKAPKPPRSWRGARDTVSFPNPAFQAAGNEMGPNGNGRMPAPSEDCLYLNLDPRRGLPAAAGDVLQPRRWLHDRLRLRHGSGRHPSGAALRRGGGRVQPSARPAGLLVPG